ncbi:platelet-derived growth factor subunit A-like isoform X1 [Cataglyphis hispanica]|uniref:platelet-derived growth factor subunit A-like isoform X1 n=1 Tax=Cataglyphis hispanica TaxID=1086592 RepID=UPI00217F299F|nr:platelet-derived growth factor subunit A-like isoform X1 [Cataglyphis hispanica]
MQLHFDASFDNQLFYFGARIFILAIVCGGFVVGQVSTQYHGNPDHIIFPGPIGSRSRALDNEPVEGSADDSDTLIPLDLAIKLNSIESSDEFLQLLRGVPEDEKKSTLSSRFGGGVERSNAERATPAKCMPELQPVSLKLDDDPSTIIFPPCTRIKRCGGCCGSSLLSCQPTAMEIRNFEVVVASLDEMSYAGRRIVPLEEHTKCKCDCRIKEEHCNEKQHYEPHNCKCVCDNVDEAEKCRKNNDTKIWNPDLCICSCRTIEPCSTGYYFNYNTCRCGPIMLSRPVNRFVSTKGSNYNFSNRRPENVPPVIYPLDPLDPRRKHKEDPEYK